MKHRTNLGTHCPMGCPVVSGRVCDVGGAKPPETHVVSSKSSVDIAFTVPDCFDLDIVHIAFPCLAPAHRAIERIKAVISDHR